MSEIPEKVQVKVKDYKLVLSLSARWEYQGKQYARYTAHFVASTIKVPVALIDKAEARLACHPQFKGWTPIPTRDFRTILLRRED